MIETKIPRRLDSDSLHDFKRTWADAFIDDPRGLYLLNSHIKVVPQYGHESRLSVYACDRNTFLIGEFRPDHGMIRSGEYYPIIVFYNQLNYSQAYASFNVGVPNNTRIELKPGDEELVINEENLLKCVRDSWEYVKIFEDCEKV